MKFWFEKSLLNLRTKQELIIFFLIREKKFKILYEIR